MPFVNVRDLSVYYEQRGRGPRLLHIGGAGAASYPRHLHTIEFLSES